MIIRKTHKNIYRESYAAKTKSNNLKLLLHEMTIFRFVLERNLLNAEEIIILMNKGKIS